MRRAALACLCLLAAAGPARGDQDTLPVYCHLEKEFDESCGDLPICSADQVARGYEKFCAQVRACHGSHGTVKETCTGVLQAHTRVDAAKGAVTDGLGGLMGAHIDNDGSPEKEKALQQVERGVEKAKEEHVEALEGLHATYAAHFQSVDKLAEDLDRVQTSYPKQPGPDGNGPPEPQGARNLVIQIRTQATAEKAKAAQAVEAAKAAKAKSDEAAKSYKTALTGGSGAGDSASAKKFLDGALKTDPNNLQARRLRALNSLRGGDCAGAAEDAQALLAANPRDEKAAGIYHLCRSAGGPKMALPPTPQRGAPPDPRLEAAAIGAAQPAARAAAFAAPAVTPATAAAPLLAQALAALRARDFAAAVAASGWALETDPANPRAWLVRAMASNGLRDYRQAILDADQGLKLAPGDARLLKIKAFAQNRGKDYRGALETADWAIQADATDPDGYAHKAFALGGLGRRAEMLESLRMAASLDPRYNDLLDAAMRLPETGDPMALFAEAKPAAQPERKAAAPPKAPLSEKRFWLFAALLGLLLALGAALVYYGLARAEAPAPSEEA
ncbi:MAG: hypothetical protein AAB320_08190 [Elusimicrobiota bacterium]